MGFDLFGELRKGVEDLGHTLENFGHAVEGAAKGVGQAIEHAAAKVVSSNAVEQFSQAAAGAWTEVTTRVSGRDEGNPPLPAGVGATYAKVDGKLFVRGTGSRQTSTQATSSRGSSETATSCLRWGRSRGPTPSSFET